MSNFGNMKKERTLALFQPIRYSRVNEVLKDKGTEVTIWTQYNDYKKIREFGTIVLSPKSSRIITSDDSVIEKEILRKLEDGGHICILCDSDSDKDSLINNILLMVGARIISVSRAVTEINIRRSEFREFLRNYGIVSNVFVIPKEIHVTVICTTRYMLSNPDWQNTIAKLQDNAVVGFTIRKEKGLITLLPFHLNSSIHASDLVKAVLET